MARNVVMLSWFIEESLKTVLYCLGYPDPDNQGRVSHRLIDSVVFWFRIVSSSNYAHVEMAEVEMCQSRNAVLYHYRL